jgi:isocitrate lyase
MRALLACCAPARSPAVERCSAAQVLLPASQFIRALVAARLAADVCGVPTVVVARTDAHSASLLTSDIDELDRPFLTGKRTPEGFFGYQHGIKARRPRPRSQA